MANIDFPSSPSLGQIYSFGARSWRWNGTGWESYISTNFGGFTSAARIDASEFIPTTTSGCGIDSTETSTNRVNRDLLTFDSGTRENAIVWFAWPNGWSSAKASFHWYATSGSGGVVFGAEMKAYKDNDAIDSAWGTPQLVLDDLINANTHRITSPTPSITPAGSPTGGEWVGLRIFRDPLNVSDTLAVDALVMGVVVEKAS